MASPESSIIYDVVIPSTGKKYRVSEDAYLQNADNMFNQAPDAEVTRTSLSTADDGEINESDVFQVLMDDGSYRSLSAEQYGKVRDKIWKSQPNAQVLKVRDMSYERFAPKQQEQRNALDEFMRANSEFLDYYEERRNSAAGDDPVTGQRQFMQDAKYLEENSEKYKSLSKQREELETAYYNNPITIREHRRNAELAKKKSEEYTKLADEADNIADKYDYKRAAKLMKDAQEMYEAPAHKGGKSFGSLEDYWAGLSQQFTNYDNWAFGLTDTIRNFNVKDVNDRIEEKEKELGRELNENEIDEILTPGEKALYSAAQSNGYAAYATNGKVSSAYKAGQGFAESIPYMIDFAITRGMGTALGKKILKNSSKAFGKWFARQLMSDWAVDKASKAGFKALSTAEALKITGKKAAKTLDVIDDAVIKPIIQGAWNSGISLRSLNSISEGALNGESFWKSFGDNFIEAWSESAGDALGLPLKGIGHIGETTLGKTSFWKMARWAYDSAPGKVMRQAGFNGLIGEMAEEWLGNAARLGTGIMNKEEFNQFASWEQQLEMAASFGPMSALGLGGSTVSAIRTGKKYKKLSEDVKGIMRKNGYSDEEIQSIFNTRFDTANDIAKKFAPVMTKIHDSMQSSDKSAEADYKTMLEFAKITGEKAIYDEWSTIDNNNKREAAKQEITTRIGHDFSFENEEGERVVQRVEGPDGKTGYIIGKADESGMRSVVWDDGRTGFTMANESGTDANGNTIGKLSKAQYEADYLNQYISDQKKAVETERITAEEQQNKINLLDKIAKDQQIPVGTEENPAYASVAEVREDGAILSMPDGSMQFKSNQELANMLNMPLAAKSDEQLDNEEADRQDKLEEKRKSVTDKLRDGSQIALFDNMDIVNILPAEERDGVMVYPVELKQGSQRGVLPRGDRHIEPVMDGQIGKTFITEEELDKITNALPARDRAGDYAKFAIGTPLETREGDGVHTYSFQRVDIDENGNISFIATDQSGNEVTLEESQVANLAGLLNGSFQATPMVSQPSVPSLPMRKNSVTGEDVVDSDTLWNTNPELWCQWNDSENRDPDKVTSKEKLEYAIKELSKKIKKISDAIKAGNLKGMDAVKKDQLTEERRKLTERQDRLTKILEEYNKPAESTETLVGAKRKAQANETKSAQQAGFPGIQQRWNETPKIDGAADEIRLPNGETVSGHYVLTEATAPTASHNPANGFKMSDGFPVDENGKTVNDRDYEHDQKAQEQVASKAASYDQRALQTPVIVSNDGVVLSGNDRTMASQIAATNGTDTEYVGYLQKYSAKYGFTAEQVGQFQNPRVVFVPDAEMPYNAATFAKFNASDQKAQSKTEKAVKAGKTISAEALGKVATLIDQYEDYNEFYNDVDGVSQILDILEQAGVITSAQRAALVDEGGKFSGEGRDLVDSVLLGSALNEEAVREAMKDASIRQSIISAIAQIIRTNTLDGYALKEELSDAILLIAEGKRENTIKFGESVQGHVRQKRLFADDVLAEATVQLLGDAINNRKPTFLKNVLTSYAEEATLASQGVQDIFLGKANEKENILRNILENLGYNINTYDTTGQQQSNADTTGTENAPAAPSGETGASIQGDQRADGEGRRAAEEVVNENIVAIDTAISNATPPLNQQTAEEFISAMESSAEAAPVVSFSDDSWKTQFPNETVETPIGQIKLGDNQINKLEAKNRQGQFGMMKPTLSNPDIILYEEDLLPPPNADRTGKLLFIKTFISPDGKKVVNFESVTVRIDNFEISVSNHIVKRDSLLGKLQSDRVVYIREALLSNSSEGRLTEQQDAVPDLVPSQEKSASTDKDKKKTEETSTANKIEKLTKRLDKWKKLIGDVFEIHTSSDTITDATVKREIEAGGLVFGWFDPQTGKAHIYLPHILSTDNPSGRLDRTIIHEVISHKGLRGLFGSQKEWNEFLDKVWESMSDITLTVNGKQISAREHFFNYVSETSSSSTPEVNLQRAAADEFIAHMAENNSSILDKLDANFWNKLAEFIKDAVKATIGIDIFSDEAYGGYLQESFMSFVKTQQQAQKQGQKAKTQQETQEDVLNALFGGESKSGATMKARENPQIPVSKSQEKIDDFGQKIGYARKDTAKTGIKRGEADGRPAWAKKYQTANVRIFSQEEIEQRRKAEVGGKYNFEIQENVSSGTDFEKPFVAFWEEERNWFQGKYYVKHYITDDKREPMLFTSKDQYEATMPVFEAKRQGFRVRQRNDGKQVITKSASNGKLVEYAEFDTIEDAQAYLSSPEGATDLLNRKRDNYELPALEKLTRNGMPDYRGGKDVTPDDILNTFGFRGGEFGNWVNAIERQQFLNYAYDAFMDLATILKISPKSLSLGGELSIAFGARGTGKVATKAHYESNFAVINLTKLNGAGSLAHEWAHALDNYFGLMDAKAERQRDVNKYAENSKFISEGNHYAKGSRNEVRTAFREVMKALTEKMEERKIVEEKEQEELNKRRNWLSRIVQSERERLARGRTTYKYNRKTKKYDDVKYTMTDEQLAEFDRLVAQLETDPTFKHDWDYKKTEYRGMGEVADKLRELVKEIIPDKKGNNPLNPIFNQIKVVKAQAERLKAAQEGKTETVRTKTTLVEDSEWFDRSRAGQYFTKEIEIFARAFETYVYGEMQRNGQSSDYLTYDKSPLYMEIWEHSPYPRGEERQTSKAAFDKLFQTIQEKTDESGNTVLFSRSTEIYPEVRAEMKAIKDAAIANGTFMKAPNGKASNLSEEQWLIVRTKNFKKWFGDWEKALTETPIHKSKGSFENLESAESWAKKNLQGKSRVNKFTGEKISIGRKSISEMLNEKALKQSSSVNVHLSALQSILDFIETGIPAEVHADTHGRSFDVMRLYNAIEIDDELYRVKSTVRKVRQGDKYYTYEIQEMELVEERGANPNREGKIPHNGNTSNNSITAAKLLKGVKKTNSTEEILQYSKVVDENGEPMVVYHGTRRGDFTVFDSTKANKERDYTYDGIHYFTESETTAKTYGDTKAAFLNIRNPYKYNFEGRSWRNEDWSGIGIMHRRSSEIIKEGFSSIEEAEKYLAEFLAEHPEYKDEDGYGAEVVTGMYVGSKGDHTDDIANKARAKGYDGTIFQNVVDYEMYDETQRKELLTPHKSFTVFSSNQIKSATDFNGEFSESDDIRFSRTSRLADNQTIQGMSANVGEIKDFVIEHIENALYDEDITIEDIEVIGSRTRNEAREDSDLDVLVQYSGNISEDTLFDIINDEPLEIDGVTVDINPIREDKSGTIDRWLERNAGFTKVNTEWEAAESQILFSRVTDKDTIDRLNNEPTIKVYRAMQVIDGKLYPPMSAKIDGKLREPIELGAWEQSEERPDLVDSKGRFKLDKANKSSVPARYNPYFHTSRTPLNDQFASAQTRPNLVTVEVEVPESELTSGYKADKAKDSVGEKEWKAGIIQGKLSGTRKVILSRWDKPVRIVPDSEVADVIVKMFEGKDITMPSNVVTPSLRTELEKRGVPFVETDNQGNVLFSRDGNKSATSLSNAEKKRLNNTIDKVLSYISNKPIKEAREYRLKFENDRKEEAAELYTRVLNNQFDSVTLQLINEYIDNVTPKNPYGRRISKRLPQEVERVLYEGARTNAVDALLSRIHEGAVPPSRRNSPSERRRIAQAKSAALKNWAIASGNWHTDLKDFTDQDKPFASGTDSDVYRSKDGQYVIKASHGKSSAKKFAPDIDNIPLFNYLFPNTAYEILGYGEIDGKFVRILKQPYIDFSAEDKLTTDERVEYMAGLGFEPINKDKTVFSNKNLVVADLQKSNIVYDKAGNIAVIDADVKLHTKDVGGEYTYPPVEDDVPAGTLFSRESSQSLVERTYRKSGAFSFTGKNRIESEDDVAFIFKQLEESSVENSFLVFVKDGIPTILHIGMGDISSTVADLSVVIPAYKDFGADRVYLVHNHPSGNIFASQADVDLLGRLQDQLPKVICQGIIINTVSGNYGLFNTTLFERDNATNVIPQSDESVELDVLSFDKNVFSPEYKSRLNERKIAGSQDVAAFLSAHRLGDGEKVGALLLNRSHTINGNLVLNDNEISTDNADDLAEQIVEAANRSGSSAAILFGDFDYSDKAIRKIERSITRISGKSVSMLDVVRLDGNHTMSLNDNTLPEKETLNDGVRFSRSNANQEIFVSNAAKAVEGIKQEKGTPQQWLAMIEKNGGLKAGEDKWLGLSDWLKSSDKKTVTKEEILDYINENKIIIEEVHYSEDDKGRDIKKNIEDMLGVSADDFLGEAFIVEELGDNSYYLAINNTEKALELYNAHNEKKINVDELEIFSKEWKTVENWADSVLDKAENAAKTKPIESIRLGYTTEFLHNKHEIALTVPTIESWNERDVVHFGDAGEGRAVAWIRFGDTTIPGESEKAKRIQKIKERLKEFSAKVYNVGLSPDEFAERAELRKELEAFNEVSYTPENDVEREIKNYIEYCMEGGDSFEVCVGYAYNQITDTPYEAVSWTTDAVTKVANGMRNANSNKENNNKKVLVIDEIQSNRHQEGREKGYRSKDYWKRRTEYLAARTMHDSLYDEMKEKYGDDCTEGDVKRLITEEEFARLVKANEEFDAAADAYKGMVNAIPDAPFDKNWHELAMKRMLRYAAENGYDVVAWTTGDQQADRYGLSRDVKKISASKPTKDGERIVNIYYRDEYNDFKNLVVNKEGKVVQGDYSGNALADVIGKEMALQIMKAEESTEFKGEGLKIGGEGMRGFYDKMLPAFMNKYGKKWGVKVEDVTLPNVEEADRVMHSIPVTEEMKTSVMEGQVMFSRTIEEKIATYDKTNETNLAGFLSVINQVKNNKPNVPKKYFTIGKTGELLNKYGIIGNITASKAIVNKRHSQDIAHKLSDQNWYDILTKINTPIIISKYKGENKSFRIYTSATILNGENIVVGIDVNTVGKNVFVSNIKTAFARELSKAGGTTETILYDKRKANGESSSAPNSQIYLQSPSSTNKDSEKSENTKTSDENSLFSRVSSYENSIEGMKMSASAAAKELGVKIELVSPSELTFDGKPLKGRWVNGKIYICAENCENSEDVIRTVLHEAVGHEGLRKLIGNERMRDFCLELLQKLPKDVAFNIADKAVKKHGANLIPATEEYIAELVEEYLAKQAENLDTNSEHNRSVWDTIRDLLRKALAKIGINIRLTHGDVQWIMWQAYNANKQNDLLNEAKRQVIANRLGFSLKQQAEDTQIQQEARNREVEEKISAAALYNQSVSDIFSRLKESFVDHYDAVNRLVESIEKATGKAAESFEDIRMALNQKSSRGKAQFDKWMREEYEKLGEIIKEIRKIKGCKYEDIERYAMLKHQLERNVVLAKRDAKEHWQDVYNKAVKEIQSNDALTKDQKAAQIEEAAKSLEERIRNVDNETDAKYLELRENDYSGICVMYPDESMVVTEKFDKTKETYEEYQARVIAGGNSTRFTKTNEKGKIVPDVAAAEEAARREVSDFEHGIDREVESLWNRINSATKSILKAQYNANMISREQYEHIRDMFKFYVPLRGFEENTAENMYEYYANNRSANGFLNPFVSAKGRKSKAAAPFATIASMASSAIAANESNRAKLALYYFLSNRPDNDLAIIADVWYEVVGQDENGKKIYEPVYPEFSEDLNSEEAKKKYQEWEDKMKEKEARGEAMRRHKGKAAIDLHNSVIHISDSQKNDHIVKFKVGGRDMMIYINGNPRAAQAINNMFNTDASKDPTTKAMLKLLRTMSALNTSLNPEFWISNQQRDLLSSLMAMSTKESDEVSKAYKKNLKYATKVITMAKALENGTLGNSKLENYYREFIENGGVTGYTVLKSVEEWESGLREMSAAERSKWKDVKSWVEKGVAYGEYIEQIPRFIAYYTMRESGKGVTDSISVAKELTVNFNRKGSAKAISFDEAMKLSVGGRPLKTMGTTGKMLAALVVMFGGVSATFRRTIMFFNASVQGLYAVAQRYAANPKRAMMWFGGLFATGAINALVHALLDDDDDEYLDIPEYERRNNLLLGFGGKYLKYALPPEMRVFFALGDIVVTHALGRKPNSNFIKDALSSLSELSPIELNSGWKGFLPSAVRPVADLITNEDYKGAKIYNDMRWLSDEEKKREPRYNNAMPNASPLYTQIAQLLNSVSGGDKYEAGWLNADPDAIEFLVESYTGGVGTTISKAVQLAENTIEGKFQVRDTPFLRRLITITDERYRNSYTTELFNYYKSEAENTENIINKAKKNKDKEKVQDVKESKDYQILKIYKSYRSKDSRYNRKVRNATSEEEKKAIMAEQDNMRKEMLKKISEL